MEIWIDSKGQKHEVRASMGAFMSTQNIVTNERIFWTNRANRDLGLELIKRIKPTENPELFL